MSGASGPAVAIKAAQIYGFAVLKIGDTTVGCDIHMHREVRRDGQWRCIESKDSHDLGEVVSGPHISRNYMLFGLLAEVRWYDCPFSFKRRGLPKDLSEQLQEAADAWESDGHSHSYLTIPELKEKQTELLVMSDADAKECLGYLQRMLYQDLEWPDDVSDEDKRIVFWFDN